MDRSNSFSKIHAPTHTIILQKCALAYTHTYIHIFTNVCVCVQLCVLSAGAGVGGSLPGRGSGLRHGHGVCAGVRVDEHTLFHQRLQAHRHLQHHDPEGTRTHTCLC